MPELKCPKCGAVLAMSKTANKKYFDETEEFYSQHPDMREKKSPPGNQTVEEFDFSADFLGYSDKAILVDNGENEMWIPLSQIISCEPDLDEEEFLRWKRARKTLELTIPLWLAKKKGITE